MRQQLEERLDSARRRTAGSGGIDQRVRGVVAHEGVHRARQAVRGRAPGHEGEPQLRQLDDPGRSRSRTRRAPPTCSRRPTRRTCRSCRTRASSPAHPPCSPRTRWRSRSSPATRKHITTVADLAQPGLIVVLCASEAPCGKYADQLLEQDNVTVTPKSRELNAKSTLGEGRVGRCRRRDRLRHRREGRRRQGRRRGDPDRPECGRNTSDRGVEGHQERRTGRRMGRLRDVERDRRRRCNSSTASSRREPAPAAGRHSPPGARRRDRGHRPRSCSSSRRSPGLCSARRGASFWSTLTEPATRTALRLSLECSLAATGARGALRAADRVAARPHRVPRQGDRARVRDPAAWCCRRSSAASRCSSRSAGAGSSASTSTAGSASRSRSRTKGVILAETFVAMPFLIITVEAALRSLDTRYEDAGATLGAEPLDRAAPDHAAGDRAVARGRRRAHLGARARRVRRDDHVRRQLQGRDADAAARRVPRARDRPRLGDRAEPRAARGVDHGARARRPARVRRPPDRAPPRERDRALRSMLASSCNSARCTSTSSSTSTPTSSSCSSARTAPGKTLAAARRSPA